MISTSFHQSPLPMPANLFSFGDNSILSSSCIRFPAICFILRCRNKLHFYFCFSGFILRNSRNSDRRYDRGDQGSYRRLARVYHPEVDAISQKDSYADEFMKIRAAYCSLSDPNKRASYDRSLFPRRRSRNFYSAAYACQNWETDQCW